MLRLLLALLVATAALAGCIGDPQDLAPAGDDGDVDPPQGNESDRSEPDEGNGTGEDDGDARNGTGESDGNETDGSDDGDEAADPGWPDPDEAAVRPGVAIADGTCTANFVFSSPDNATLYVGTAAHCFPDPDPGQAVSIADGAATGELAYHSFQAMERVNESNQAAWDFNDFALVRIDPGFRDTVHPAVRTYGGPTGLSADAGTGDRVLTTGDTSLRNGADALDPREGYVTGSSPWHVDVQLYAPSVPGDSGSPVLTADGRALANLVTIEVLPQTGSNDATKITRAVAYMEDHGGPQVELETWTQLSPGILPG